MIPYPEIVVGVVVRSANATDCNAVSAKVPCAAVAKYPTSSYAAVPRSAVFAFSPIELVTEVAKLGSSPNAAASSFNVSNVVGAVSIKLDIAVPTYVSVAYPFRSAVCNALSAKAPCADVAASVMP